jgi:hypothetical protein
MKFEIENSLGFWGIGIWIKPHLKLITIAFLCWQFRFYLPKPKEENEK